MKESRSVNFENFPSAPTMGAPMGLTIYVETQSLLKNGSHQNWLHEALHIYAFILLLISSWIFGVCYYTSASICILSRACYLVISDVVIAKHHTHRRMTNALCSAKKFVLIAIDGMSIGSDRPQIHSIGMYRDILKKTFDIGISRLSQ